MSCHGCKMYLAKYGQMKQNRFEIKIKSTILT